MKTLILLLPFALLAQAALAESPFACDRMALGAAARKRHFDELSPALRAAKKQVRELSDGYEFEFTSDPEIVRMLSEWVAGEHLCCPFFDIDLRFECENGPVRLRLTGREGTKQFIKSDLSRWFPK